MKYQKKSPQKPSKIQYSEKTVLRYNGNSLCRQTSYQTANT